MECEQSYFTFCTLFPLAIGFFVFLKVDTLIDIALNGVGTGRLKKIKNSVTVQTTEGNMKVPTAKLPNLDWEVYLVNDDTEVKDGMNDLDVINDANLVKCKQYRDLLMCEYLYSSDFKKGDIKVVISSPLDDLCYIFSVKEGEMIDYKKHIELFLEEIEEN